MGDIFDDIDEILSAADDIDATAETSECEMSEVENFNEAELQDIMSEIESLEKDFDDSSTMDTAAMIQDAVMEEINAEFTKDEGPKASLQDEIERELAACISSEEVAPVAQVATSAPVTPVAASPVTPAPVSAPVVAAAPAAPAPVAQVLHFEKPTPKATTPMTQSSGVSFAAQGSMAMTIDFKVGEESAKLSIDPTKGLVVTLAGVELVINEKDGCHVTMENGMKFSIPLSSLEKSQKKSA